MTKQLLMAFAAVCSLVTLTATGAGAEKTTLGNWTFEAGAQSAPDVSDLSNDGTIFNGTVVAGFRGEAIEFNGASTYVNVGDPGDGSLELEDYWSIELRLKTEAEGNSVLVAKGGVNGPGYAVTLEGGLVRLAVRDKDGDTVSAKARLLINEGDWHRVVVAREHNKLKVCVDTAPMIIEAVPFEIDATITSDAAFTIGARVQGGVATAAFAGVLDDVKVVKGEILCREDMTPPTLTCSVTPTHLWPLNQIMVQTFVEVFVSDGQSGPATFQLVSTTSSEPDYLTFDDDKNDDFEDWNIGGRDTRGRIRAERSNNDVTRVYTLTYEGFDIAGNSGFCSVEVIATHDRPADMPNSHLHDGWPLEIKIPGR